MRTPLLILAAALAVPAAAQQATAPFTVAETGQGFRDLQEAVTAIGDGQGTIVIAPGQYRQCAVQNGGRVTFRARDPGSAIFDGTACEGKAALVLRGLSARVEGLVFQNMRVADANGAGIRIEQGDLHVTESLFRDSETGILSAEDRNATIRIERSTFSGLGRCRVEDGNCSHGLYIGHYGRAILDQVRFERGRGGHYLKLRTPQVEIRNSSFDDSQGTQTSYLIHIAEGATGAIAGNAFVQGPAKENYTALIMIGGERTTQNSDGLAITGNEASTAPGFREQTSFIADFLGAQLRIEGNRLSGRITQYDRRWL